MSKKFSMIVPAHNEGKNLLKFLKNVEGSDFREEKLDEIIVIASGKTGYVEKICEKMSLPIRLLTQRARKGKAAAINEGLKEVETELVVLSSADIVLDRRAIAEVLKEIEKRDVGLVTVRPVPETEDGSFTDYFVELIWGLHHEISKKEPKAGEMIGFKNVIERIPEDTAADEEFIKAIVLKKGYESRYASDAVVFNRGPDNVPDLFKQRRRVYIGHLDLEKRGKYCVPSMKTFFLLEALSKYIRERGLHPYLPLSLIFEVLARADAWVKYNIFGENPYKWERVG
ncbi:MAG: glycosyltransferase [Candidatus Aenigmatarchaeota archaeon]